MTKPTGDRGTKWGGQRPGAGRKPFPQMRPGEVVIDARDARAYVSRWQRNGSQFWLDAAQNWEDLEGAAIGEIEALGGYVTMSGIYPCSDALGKRARWDV